VQLLRPARRDGAPGREGREAPDSRRRSHHGLRAVLPTSAIHFGNLKDAASVVVKAGSDPVRGYHSLHELNTRPAVTYLAKVKRGSVEG